MEKYIFFLVYLAVPMEVVYLYNKKQRKSLFVSIVITLIALPITLLIASGNKPVSIATLIEKMLYPIIKKQ